MVVGLAAEEAGSIAQHLLRASAQCRHCNGTSDLEYIKDGLTGILVCPGRYVTRIIAYGKEVDADEFKKFVQGTVQGMGKVENVDIRMTSTHGISGWTEPTTTLF